MVISVITGGPQNVASPQIDQSAPTFQSMVDAISDEVDDTQGEYVEQIQNAIFAAIRYCERDVYYFNETRDVTFFTVSGQEWYGADDNAQIPKLVRVAEAYCVRSDGQSSILRRTTNEEIETLVR